jgi:kynurenine formamidase
VAALQTTGAAAEEPPKNFRSVVDLTHALNADFPTYPGPSGFHVEKVLSYQQDRMNVNNWQLAEHVGTHMDAPLHFSADGADLATIPVTSLFVPLVIIDIRGKSEKSVDAQVTPEDLSAHIKQHGPLPAKCCVIMQSGWSRHVSSPRYRGEDGGTLHFPGFHPDTARKLIEESQVVGMGVDTLSLDFGPSKEFETHRLWLPSGRWGLECLNLSDSVPQRGAYLFAGCPKVNLASGGPTRVVAFVP